MLIPTCLCAAVADACDAVVYDGTAIGHECDVIVDKRDNKRQKAVSA